MHPRHWSHTCSALGLMGWLGASLVAHAAEPRWESVGLFDQAAVSVDTANVSREGVLRKLWSMMDHKSAQKNQRGQVYWSTRSHMEINCASREMRILQWSWHEKPRLGGAVVDREGAFNTWQAIPPATPIEKIARRVC